MNSQATCIEGLRLKVELKSFQLSSVEDHEGHRGEKRMRGANYSDDTNETTVWRATTEESEYNIARRAYLRFSASFATWSEVLREVDLAQMSIGNLETTIGRSGAFAAFALLFDGDDRCRDGRGSVETS